PHTGSSTARSTASVSPRRPRPRRRRARRPPDALMADSGGRSFETHAAVLTAPRPVPRSRCRVLITGAAGMLGSDLAPVLAGAGYEVIPRSKAELDIADAAALAWELAASRPDVLVNCAAFTKVDACETDPLAFAVNADAVGLLADACGHRSCQLVQISTDFVFDGTKRAPYVEEDPTRPLSAYGRSKRSGTEHA